jgi:hypothetical protein
MGLKYNRILIVLAAVFLVVTSGCSNRIKNEGNKIVVEKRVGAEDKYEYYHEITDSKAVERAKDILYRIRWENALVSMVEPPHYKFHFTDTNREYSPNELTYHLWISPGNEKIELVVVGETKYVQLDKKKSAELFEIITGRKLGDL